MATTITDTSNNSANIKQGPLMSSPDTSEFYLECIVMLEGVEVPFYSITVSYGVMSPPTCTIIIPAHSFIRDLPSKTKIHVFFKDLIEDTLGERKWRLLFDGELSGYSYSSNDSGAYASITGIHSTSYTTIMQLMTLDASQYLFNTSTYVAGNATIPILFGQNRMNSSMIADILKGKYDSMADIVFKMMQGVLEGSNSTATNKFYADKLGNKANGWKILNRIYGVSAATRSSPPPKIDWTAPSSGSAGSNKNSSEGTAGVYAPRGIGYSKYYTNQDFISPNDGYSANFAGMDALLIEKLDSLTDVINTKLNRAVGTKLTINSGYRSPEYNATLEGSATNSQHCLGTAVDIDVPGGLNIDELANIGNSVGFVGIGTYRGSSFVHFDVRVGGSATWEG